MHEIFQNLVFDREHSSRGLSNSFDCHEAIEFSNTYFQMNFVMVQTKAKILVVSRLSIRFDKNIEDF